MPPLSKTLLKFATNLRFILISLLFSSAFFSSLPAAGRDIVIGQSIDISGPQSDIGKDYLAGAKVYFDFINSSGGISGRKIVHLVADNQGSAEKSEQITRDFLSKQRVDALFGYFCQNCMESMLDNSEFKHSSVPLVAPLSGIETARGSGNVFFIRASYATEAKKLVNYFHKQGVTKFSAIYASNNYGKASLAAVENELKSQNLGLMSRHAINQDGADIDSAAKAINASNPQAVIVILETLPAAQFVKAYRKLDVATYILSLSMINHVTLFEIAGQDYATGTVLAQVMPHPRNWYMPIVMEHDKIMKIYRDEPPSHLTIEGFIAAKLLVSALKDTGKDTTPERLSASLKEIRKLDVGGYTLDFSAQKNRGSSYVDINMLTKKGGLLH